MLRELYYINSNSVIPYVNQGLEEYLLQRVRPGQLILYLWQNSRTVVIGRNQNCWCECRVEQLLRDNGFPARRLSGGGAVFHDLGNLNFTFLCCEGDYDLEFNLAVIAGALSHTGISTELSGRNDLLAAGRKFSGNAFYKSGGQCFHHGTIMVDVDLEEMSRYLQPSTGKLAAHGVASVRSRVVNLSEMAPQLTVAKLRELLIGSLGYLGEREPRQLELSPGELHEVEKLELRYGDWDWICGRLADFDIKQEQRFPWGGVNCELQVGGGVITEAVIYSDAMEALLIPRLAAALANCRYESGAICDRLAGVPGDNAQEKQIITDICDWLRQSI